jgi:ribosomal protein S18 acetylase RimI-like enzyme
MKVRRLEERDISPFRGLRFRALRESAEAYVGHIREEQELSPGEFGAKTFSWDETPWRFVYGAFLDGRLTAACGFRRLLPLNLQHKGELWSVYVAPEGRGQGLGKAVVAATIEEARRLAGLERINVYASGPEAVGFYKQLGFMVFGVEPRAKKVNGVYVDLTYMALDLTSE